LLAWVASTEANWDPFCTRLVFSAADVLGSKNAVQLAVIACSAAAPDVGSAAADGVAAAEGVAAADGEAVAEGAAEDDDAALGVEPLLEQAVTARAEASSIHASDLRAFIRLLSRSCARLTLDKRKLHSLLKRINASG
jgi:hypothetical protein